VAVAAFAVEQQGTSSGRCTISRVPMSIRLPWSSISEWLEGTVEARIQWERCIPAGNDR